MATKLQIRRDTASNWTSANPTLSAGELGFETDTLKLKIGTGSTAWSSLSYFVGDVTGYLGGGNVQHIIPAGNELYDLGDSDSRFRDLYLSGSTIKLGSVTLSVDSGTNALVLPAGTQLGNVAVLDSAGVQNVINQTYIRANQIQYNTSDFADSSFVTTQVNALVDAAPGALNTLNELAAALGDDANFSTTITNSIAGKLDSAATTTLIDSSYVQARQASGGSGGSLTATAAGALANGDMVIINADGTVSAIGTESVSAATGSAAVYKTDYVNEQAVAYDTANNRVVAAYRTTTPDAGYVVVGSVSGTSITWGTPVQFNDSETTYVKIVYDSGSGKVLIGFYESAGAHVIVGTVSGMSISLGTAVSYGGSSSWNTLTYDSTNNKAVVVYRDGSNSNYGTAKVGTVSGTSISFGSATVFNSGTSNRMEATFDSTNGKVLIAYQDGSDNNYGKIKVGTVSGTGVSFGSEAVFHNANTSGARFFGIGHDATSGKSVIAYTDQGDSNKGKARVITVSGTSASFGTIVTYNSGATKFSSVAVNTAANKILIAYQDDGDNGYAKSSLGTISGTDISFATEVTLHSADAEYSQAVYNPDTKSVIITYEAGDDGYGIVRQTAFSISRALTSENFIGVSNDAYADGATATIQITGSVDDAQSGLTAGQRYFIESDGSLSTSPDTISVIAGTAVSATKLLINADVDTDTLRDSSFISGLIDSSYVQARQSAAIDSAATIALIDSSYVQARQTTGGSVDSAATISLINSNTNSGFSKFRYTATANQTIFKDSDASGNILAFDPNSTVVFYNGIMLDETSDYTVSSNTITLTSGADAGVSLSVVKFGVGYIAPAFPWGGSRGFKFSGSSSIAIDYFNIASPGNAADFGDIRTGGSASQCVGTAAVSNGTRAVIACGRNNHSGSYVDANTLEYITCATTGNGTDFGDLSVARYQSRGVSDGTKGHFTGGYVSSGSYKEEIDVITIATTGNATDFGDMNNYDSYRSRAYHATAGDTSYGIMAGGSSDNSGAHNYIQYITYASPGNAVDFGDLTRTATKFGGCADATRSVFCGGSHETGGAGNKDDTIDYVTTQTAGNATDFGNCTYSSQEAVSCSDGTYGTHMGGYDGDNGYAEVNKIDYFTIQTPANAADFGDLVASVNLNTCSQSGNAS